MSPGISGIPVKILKFCSQELSLTISKFINSVLDSGLIPTEWKYAIVTPLFKGSINQNDIPNGEYFTQIERISNHIHKKFKRKTKL